MGSGEESEYDGGDHGDGLVNSKRMYVCNAK